MSTCNSTCPRLRGGIVQCCQVADHSGDHRSEDDRSWPNLLPGRVTPLDLDAIEAKATAPLLGPFASDQWNAMRSKVVALVAEVRALRSLISSLQGATDSDQVFRLLRDWSKVRRALGEEEVG